MTTDRDDLDDEALRWAGDEDRGRMAPRLREPVPAEADPANEEPEGDPEDDEDDEPDRPPLTAGRRALFAVFGVLYLALVIAWVLGVQTTSAGTTDLFTQVSWQFGEFLAMIGPVVWFAAVLTLTRASRARVSAAWLVAGIVVFAPLPFVFGVLL